MSLVTEAIEDALDSMDLQPEQQDHTLSAVRHHFGLHAVCGFDSPEQQTAAAVAHLFAHLDGERQERFERLVVDAGLLLGCESCGWNVALDARACENCGNHLPR